MPVALKVAPTDTTIPALTRRRVWVAPEVRSHSLIVLTFTKLHLAPATADPPKPGLAEAVENGAELYDVVGPMGTVIDLMHVRRVRLDLLTNSVAVDYATGNRPASTTIRFATPEAADALFSKLWRRLGTDFLLTPYKPDIGTTARGPLAVMAGLLAATIGLAVGLPAAADAGAALPTWLDWKLVCGIGGAGLAVAQVWLYRRWTQPPARLELVRAG